VKTEKVGDLTGEIGTVRQAFGFHLHPDVQQPEEGTIQTRDAFEDTAFGPGFEILKL
jgi:hypothetical protein